MSLPSQGDLLGLDWGFGGDVHSVLATKSTLTPGFAEWNLGGQALQFASLGSVDDMADRAVTAARAMVLMGNPSTADASVTVVRSMVLRSAAADDADRNISALRLQALMGNPSTADAIATALRVAVLRTNDDPFADRRVSNILASILRAVRRGDVARPSAMGRVVINDRTVTPGLGEYDIRGYYGVASPVSGWTGFPYFPNTYTGPGASVTTTWAGEEPAVGPKKTPFPIGYGGDGDLSKIIRQFHEGLTQRDGTGAVKPLYNTTFHTAGSYWYPSPIVAEIDDTGNTNPSDPSDLGNEGNFPVGMSAGPLTQKTWGIGAFQPLFYSKINENFEVEPSILGLMFYAVEPHPDAQQWALPAFSVYQHIRWMEGLDENQLKPYRQRTAVTINVASFGTAEMLHVAPKLNIALTMGRGAYRIAPNSYRDWNVLEDGLPPLRFPLQGSNDPMEEMYGVTYGSEKALWEALSANPDLSPMNLDWPARDGNSVYRANTDYSWWAVMPHRWGPARAFATVGGGELTRPFYVNDDGLYVTKDGARRYSRYKTLLMFQNLAYDQQDDLSGEPEDPFEANRLVRGYVPHNIVTAPPGVGGATWDFNEATLVFVGYAEDTEPGSSEDIVAWLQEDMSRFDYSLDKVTNGGTADEAKVFWTQFMTDERPDWIAPVNAAWDAREDEIGNVEPDYTKGYRPTLSGIWWDADDVDPTKYNGTVLPPCFYLEKLDSPSTHFNDPPGTPGVDDF